MSISRLCPLSQKHIMMASKSKEELKPYLVNLGKWIQVRLAKEAPKLVITKVDRVDVINKREYYIKSDGTVGYKNVEVKTPYTLTHKVWEGGKVISTFSKLDLSHLIMKNWGQPNGENYIEFNKLYYHMCGSHCDVPIEGPSEFRDPKWIESNLKKNKPS